MMITHTNKFRDRNAVLVYQPTPLPLYNLCPNPLWSSRGRSWTFFHHNSSLHYTLPHPISIFLFLQHGLIGQKEDSQVCTYHRQISFTSTRPLSEFKAIISGGCAEADVLDICFLPLPPFFFLTGSGDGMSSSSCMSAWTSLASTSLKQSEKVKKDMCDVRVYPCNWYKVLRAF